MGVEVEVVDTDRVVLTAPIENNINHKCTAFGGSIYSVAVLAGWGVIFANLNKLGIQAHIVIQESSIKFIQPIKKTIRAICRIESGNDFKMFVDRYMRRGMSRIDLRVSIEGGEGEACVFHGRYVIHKSGVSDAN